MKAFIVWSKPDQWYKHWCLYQLHRALLLNYF